MEIADFVAHAPVPADVIEEYRERVPEALVEVWERYGYGSFAGGFLRTIDPKLYEAEVGDCIGRVSGSPVNIPVMVTGMGDLVTWETDQFVAIQYWRQQVTGLGSRLSGVVRRAGSGMLLEHVGEEIFTEAIAAHGDLAYDQSFVFVPLISLGGESKVENLHKRETIASIQVAVEFQGVIDH
jgi:hypothetical protein